MKKILIIGGTRFLGPALIKELDAINCEITIFNRGYNYNTVLSKKVKRIKGDRRDTKTMGVLLRDKYNLIYDLCCFNKTDAVNLLTNIQPSAHIIFLSTAAVYKKPKIYPLRETSELGEWDSFGDYGTKKVDAEKQFISYSKKHGLKLTIFRPVYLLGKNNYFDRENYYFSRIINRDPIIIPGKGNALMQFAFLEETVKAFKVVPEKQEQQIEILNVGGNEFISIKNFVLMCSEIVKKEPTLIELDSKRYGFEEEHFYDDFYPFPNLTFIVSNQMISEKYGIQFKSLQDGMHNIYLHWKKHWDGKTKKYSMEMETLKKLQTI